MISTDAVSQVRWLPCLNVSGRDVPGFALLRMTGIDPETKAVRVDVSDGNTENYYLIAQPEGIAADAFGSGTPDLPNYALYEESEGMPDQPQIWGPRAGSWKLHPGVDGFLIWGGAGNGIVLVQLTRCCPVLPLYYYYGYSGIGGGRRRRIEIPCCPNRIPDTLYFTSTPGSFGFGFFYGTGCGNQGPPQSRTIPTGNTVKLVYGPVGVNANPGNPNFECWHGPILFPPLGTSTIPPGWHMYFQPCCGSPFEVTDPDGHATQGWLFITEDDCGHLAIDNCGGAHIGVGDATTFSCDPFGVTFANANVGGVGADHWFDGGMITE